MLSAVVMPALIWWLIVEILGLVALPLTFRLFRALPDRGYALSKPLGILLCSYLFWILVSFGFLANKRDAIVFVILLGTAISWYLYSSSRREGEEILAFLYRHRRVVLASELLFTAAFGLWALVRAYNPEIMGTEKPMEFAFLNAILRSEHFPPHDPWLSGYGISYYYFGYLMMAFLTRLSGLPSEVTFNLGIALLFALTLTGASSLVYNLVHQEKEKSALTFGFLGALLVALIGNLEGFLEVLHTRGLGSASFWKWVDIRNLAAAPVSGQWLPAEHWWWWRASRVVHDVMPEPYAQPIDEFPFFSFLLGDMHPHVLALPFVLLVLALALNLFRSRERLGWLEVGLLGLLVGALGFLNFWDLPTYGLIVVAAYAIGRYIQGQATLSAILEFAGKVVIASLLLYLPFYLGFRSQAGGILPVLFVKTRWHHYLVIFGLFVFILLPFLIAQLRELLISEKGIAVRVVLIRGFSLFLALLISPLFLLLLTLSIVLINEGTRAFVIQKLREAAPLFPQIAPTLVDSNPWPMLRLALLDPLLSQPWLTILLAILLWLTLFPLWRRMRAKVMNTASNSLFVLLLVAMGFLLTYLCEYLYIRDVFGTRMNTIFKLYYQAWVLLAIASAYGVYYLSRRLRGVAHYLWKMGFLVLLTLSLIYPLAATHSKIAGALPTLDGMAYLRASQPDDYQAIQWLRVNVEGSPVILEAPGGSYTLFGRVSAHTGLPTLLGWGAHELQWRGTYEEPSRREPDIETLYTSLDLEETERLLEEYNIEYVYLGPLEISKYKIGRAMIEKWATIMDVVYQQGGVTIYRRR